MPPFDFEGSFPFVCSSLCGAMDQCCTKMCGSCTSEEMWEDFAHENVLKDSASAPPLTNSDACTATGKTDRLAEGPPESHGPDIETNFASQPSRKDFSVEDGLPGVVCPVCDASADSTSRAYDMGQASLRGVSSESVLRRRGRLLSNTSGSAATWALSKPVDHLDAFISHNWCVSGHKKWLALCLHYNLAVAVCGGLFFAGILAVATGVGVLPTSAIVGRTQHEAVYGRVFGFLVFGTLLLFGPDVLPRCCTGHAEVFLDKACIHQVDKTLQREGIEHLGGFLFYSWSFVVLYTGTYTMKVWTVYEMACFLCLHPKGRLVWLPLDLPPLILVGSCLQWLGDILFWASLLRSVRTVVAIPDIAFTIVYLPGIFVITWMSRKLVRHQTSARAGLKRFSIKDAVCAVESDRFTVEENVVSLMRQLKCVPSDCTRDGALAAFDLLVRRRMPRLIIAATGRSWLRYEHLVIMQFGPILFMFDVVAAEIAEGASIQRVTARIIELITRNLACFPLISAVGLWLCRRCQELEGAKEIIFVALVAAVCFVVGLLQYVMLRLLQTYAIDNVIILAVLCLVSAGLFAFTYVVYRRPLAKVRRRRTGTAAESTEEMAAALAKVCLEGSLTNDMFASGSEALQDFALRPR